MSEQTPQPPQGLTVVEMDVLAYISRANARFQELEPYHVDETREFTECIHRLQGIIAVRVATRMDPDMWCNDGTMDIPDELRRPKAEGT